ncbi:histidine kinase [Actinomadura viridis]|uniref:histidine kinase n=1 Tax=Actinomadura viridis TaxID=58110 RepID=A0A931GH12_9ACTN|nr:sensor histidine kinase [Actinomadura viridis]MBG6086930.1 signal transduction histidine kinase [Actinomadura viridis]
MTGWPGIADFAVPAVLAAAQIAVTWLLTTGADRPLGRDRWMAGLTAILICNLALIWRRVAPVPVLAVTIAVGAAGILAVHEVDALVGGIADGVALFSVAVHRRTRTAVIATAAALAVMWLAFAPVRGGPATQLTNAGLDVTAFVGVAALGQLRRQRKARRLELTARLAEAERERRDAAAAERERLARDLHDVAGHHLSAVVVHSTAASRLDDPDLAGRALRAAADTGREVLKALSRLVDVVGPESGDGRLETLLPPLCRGLVRLGVPVTLSVEGPRRLRPQVTNAAYRIVQEALTNAMRYAQGAAVNVSVRYGSGALEVSVANAAPAEEMPVPALGGGRGIAGMRERAEALGGTLAAGPDGSGGWTVRAVLPTSPSKRPGPGWPEVLDAAAIGACVAPPSLLAFAPPEEVLAGWPVGSTLLALAALVGRALPLWWRRRAPWAALAAITLIDSAWLVVAGRAVSGTMMSLLLLGCPASMIAVYSVGCYARRTVVTWPAPLIAALPWGLAFAVTAALENRDGPDRDVMVPALVAGVLLALLVLLPFWAWGRVIGGRGVRWEAHALETMAARAGEAVFAERHRVAMGLRGTVLDHTTRLIRSAEAGLAGQDAAGSADTGAGAGPGTDAREALMAVSEHARAALTDMRALLDAMREDQDQQDQEDWKGREGRRGQEDGRHDPDGAAA